MTISGWSGMLAVRYLLTMIDPAPGNLNQVLPTADQLVLVALSRPGRGCLAGQHPAVALRARLWRAGRPGGDGGHWREPAHDGGRAAG